MTMVSAYATRPDPEHLVAPHSAVLHQASSETVDAAPPEYPKFLGQPYQ